MKCPTVYVALQQFCEENDRPRALLQDAGFDVLYNKLGRRVRREEMADLLREADAVLAGVEPYDAETLTVLPRLRCISRCGSGTDSIDMEEAQRRGIHVYTTVDETIEPVAQMTCAMIFALARNFSMHLHDFQKGQWRKRIGILLSEWTIGLIGFGRVGRVVEQYLRPFRPRIIVSDPHIKADQIPAGVEQVDLFSLLSQSDLVSIHANRPAAHGPILGCTEFGAMKRGSRLVNTARGHLIDEKALSKALESNRLAGAALDVFEMEPYQGPLAKFPQVLCTPHIASLTRASRFAMELRCAQNVVEFFSKGISP